jgi:hypothetical protein
MRRKQLAKHLNKREVINPRLIIKYHKDRPPDKSTKKRIAESASVACAIMRTTVWEIDKSCLFYRDETSLMTGILNEHFCFKNAPDHAATKDASGKLVNAKERRKKLSIIRKHMLSISFHLNTGMYLLDTDAGFRTIVGDNEIDDMNELWAEKEYVKDASGDYVDDPSNPGYALARVKPNKDGKRVLSADIEAYAQTGSSGPVHVSFELAKTYSALEWARLIVHEASHTFCGTTDVKYAHDDQYYSQRPDDMVTNADSYAYAAVSLGAGRLHTYASLKGAHFKS